jgi:hypothetical protein
VRKEIGDQLLVAFQAHRRRSMCSGMGVPDRKAAIDAGTIRVSPSTVAVHVSAGSA